MCFGSTAAAMSHAANANSTQRLREGAGTPAFMSPELCAGIAYNGQLADVWALGATMYMIRCGRPPFVSMQIVELYDKVG
jgi:calcium/calmodulin-dependent protein kinase kinase 2